MSIGSFRQGVTTINRSRGSGGRKVSWRQRMDLPKEHENAEPFTFLDAAYPDPYAIDEQTRQLIEPPPERPYNHSRSHRCKFGEKDFAEFYCSAGRNPYQPQPCVGCHTADRKSKTVNQARDVYHFNLLHVMPYHKTPLINKQGQVVMKDDGTGPILVETRCTLQGCTYCTQNAQYRQGGQQDPYPLQYGAHKYLEVGSGHIQNIREMDAMVSAVCGTCMTNVRVTGYRCPSCKITMLDVASCGWTNEQIGQFAARDYTCQRCQQIVRPEETGVCGFDATGFNRHPERPGCPQGTEPKRLSLFNTVFYLKKVGQQQHSKITCVQFAPVERFALPDGRSIKDLEAEVFKKPFDFPAMAATIPLDEQAKLARVPNPYLQGSGPGYPPSQTAPPPGSIPPAQVYGQPQPAVQYPNLPVPGRPPYGQS